MRYVSARASLIALLACDEPTVPRAIADAPLRVRSLTSPTACEANTWDCYDSPVHLGRLINTDAYDGGPSLSANGLELYFVSGRPGALGGPGDQDIYITRRKTSHDDWGPPERVPPPISSPFFDITPSISRDGLTLYFGSNRTGPFSPPLPDLWVAHRASQRSPWGEPENLGAGVNTPLFEGSISVSEDDRTAYFAGTTDAFVFKLYVTTRNTKHEPFGPRTPVELGLDPDWNAYGPALTLNGHAMFFAAGKDNPFAPRAINNLYVTARRNRNAPWGPPVFLSSTNCPACFSGLPTISADARTLCWMGDRGDSFGDKDIYCAERKAAKP